MAQVADISDDITSLNALYMDLSSISISPDLEPSVKSVKDFTLWVKENVISTYQQIKEKGPEAYTRLASIVETASPSGLVASALSDKLLGKYQSTDDPSVLKEVYQPNSFTNMYFLDDNALNFAFNAALPAATATPAVKHKFINTNKGFIKNLPSNYVTYLTDAERSLKFYNRFLTLYIEFIKNCQYIINLDKSTVENRNKYSKLVTLLSTATISEASLRNINSQLNPQPSGSDLGGGSFEYNTIQEQQEQQEQQQRPVLKKKVQRV